LSHGGRIPDPLHVDVEAMSHSIDVEGHNRCRQILHWGEIADGVEEAVREDDVCGVARGGVGELAERSRVRARLRAREESLAVREDTLVVPCCVIDKDAHSTLGLKELRAHCVHESCGVGCGLSECCCGCCGWLC